MECAMKIITMLAAAGCCLSVDGAFLNGLAALAGTTTTDMILITLPKAIGNGNLNMIVFFWGVYVAFFMQNFLLI